VFGFAPGTCGWHGGTDAAEAQRRQAQAIRAERRAAQRRQAGATAEAEDSPWCGICRRGLRRHGCRCLMCWTTAVINVGCGLELVGGVGGEGGARGEAEGPATAPPGKLAAGEVAASLCDRDDARVESFARILYDQAVIAEGSKVKDPVAFAQRVNELLVQAAGG
jgi:hypothetical protein